MRRDPLPIDVPLFPVEQHNHWKRKRKMRGTIHEKRTVKIERTKLVEKLRKNRGEHEEIYHESVEGYLKALREALTELGEKVTHIASEGEDCDLHAHWENIQREELSDVVKLRKPKNSLTAYDEAIEIFEWDETEQVELTMKEFRSYVLDKWDWQDQWLHDNSGYSKSAMLRSMAVD